MKRSLILGLSFLACSACDVGDVGSSHSSTESHVGVAECTYECQPTEGGWSVRQVCSGRITDGPDFSEARPQQCAFEPEEEEADQPEESEFSLE